MSPFIGFVSVYHAGIGVIGAPSPEVFVAFAHVAIRQSGRFAQQLVHNFVQFIHVFGKGFSVGQMACAQRVVFEVGFQIDAAVFAGQHVLQSEYKCPIVAFVRFSGMHRIIETHGV